MTSAARLCKGTLALAACALALAGCASGIKTPAAPPVALAPSYAAGDIAGQWQGTLEDGKSHRRLVLLITKTGAGWGGTFYSIDQSGEAFKISLLTLDGQDIRASISGLGLTYAGTLSADGMSIVGSRTQGTGSLPLTLVRAAGSAAWKIPKPPSAPKLMAVDANVAFKKATIKPGNAAATSLGGIILNGRSFWTRDTSVVDLISYAYEVQAKQVVNGPEWIAKERWDINTSIESSGEPSHQQLRVMMKKLLAERFGLVYHADKQDLPVYVLRTVQGGGKLEAVEADRGQLPSFRINSGFRGITLVERNATLEDFAISLQLIVLDRPVVDLTKLTGRYDFQCIYTPEGTQFGGHPPKLTTPAGPEEAAPKLVEAMQQQLGLDLSAEDAFVDVMVVDHIERPTEK